LAFLNQAVTEIRGVAPRLLSGNNCRIMCNLQLLDLSGTKLVLLSFTTEEASLSRELHRFPADFGASAAFSS